MLEGWRFGLLLTGSFCNNEPKFMKEFAYITDEGQVQAALRAVPMLGTFSEEQLEDVLNSSSLIQCDAGDTIIKEGTTGSRIYVLLSGTLHVCIHGKKVATISRAGEVFGELALLNEDKRLASIIATTKAACLAIDQKFLQEIRPREEDPTFHAALYEFVARVVAKKLDATSRRLAEVEKEVVRLREAADTAAVHKPAPRIPPRRPPLKKRVRTIERKR